MAINRENTAVTDYWEQFVIRQASLDNIELCDAAGNSLGLLITSIEDDANGLTNITTSDGMVHPVSSDEIRSGQVTNGVLTFTPASGNQITISGNIQGEQGPRGFMGNSLDVSNVVIGTRPIKPLGPCSP